MQCLLVCLQQQVLLAPLETVPSDPFEFDGRTFVDVGGADFTGFYDWVRDSCGNVIGVRYWPLKQRYPGERPSSSVAQFGGGYLAAARLQDLHNAARSLPYVRIGSTGAIEVRFIEGTIDEDASIDQAFVCSRVFFSGGEYGLLFETGDLDAAELDSLVRIAGDPKHNPQRL